MRERNKKNKNTAFFIIAIVCSILFLAMPVLIRCQCIYRLTKQFLEWLGPYKASYIEAGGAMIGGFLAVTSAIWVQSRSEISQQKDATRKYATIVYYDIKNFYEENNIFASRVIEALQKHSQHKQSKDEVLKVFYKFKDNSGVLIEPKWFSAVAELSSDLNQQTIDELYWFYGNATNIKNRLEHVQDYDFDEVSAIGSYLRNIGERTPAYQPNKKVQNLLTTLRKLIDSLD